MRLNSINYRKSRKFFIMAGESEKFTADFEQLKSGRTVTKNKLPPTNRTSNISYNSVYNKMFSFDEKNPNKKINVTDPDISKLINGFGKKYSKDYRNNSAVTYKLFLEKISKITTTLVFLSSKSTSARVGIWEVKRNI